MTGENEGGYGIPAAWPLQASQQALWLEELLRGPSAAYNVPLGYRFTGRVDADRLEQALIAVVGRHPILSSRVVEHADGPMLVREPDAHVTLERVDVRELPLDARQDAVARAASAPIKLDRAPMIAATLFRMESSEHILLVVAHHICFDSWSAGVFRRELERAYEDPAAFVREVELPVAMEPAAIEELLAYWRRRLVGLPAETTWPLSRPRPERPTHVGEVLEFCLPEALATAVRQRARQCRTTPFAVFATVLHMLLARVGHGDEAAEVVIGTPVTLRNGTSDENVVDYRANTIVLRQRVEPDEAFLELLSRAARDIRADIRHAGYPFPWLVRDFATDRSLGRPPLVQVLLVLEDEPAVPLALDDVSGIPIPVHTGTAKFDMSLMLAPNGAGFAGTLEWSCELYDASAALAFVDSFTTLLAQAVTYPETAVGALPVVPTKAPAYSARSAAIPAQPLAHELFARQVALRPKAPAVQWDDGVLSYDELDRASAALASKLRSSARGDEDVVALCAHRSPELAVAVLAILRSGLGYVPLDPGYPRDRLDYMLADSGASLLLCEASLTDAVTVPTDVQMVPLGDVLAAPTRVPPLPSVSVGSLGYVIYTSGSTGQPKGVEMPHGPLANLLAWQNVRSAADASWRTLQFAAFSFDVAFQEMFSTWGTGGTLVLVNDDIRRDPARLLDYLDKHAVHRLFLPFVALQALAEAADSRGRAPTHLREVVTAGEQLVVTPAIRALFLSTGASLENQYGPSETHVITAERLADDPTMWPSLPPIGHPIVNAQVRVVDPRGLELPRGVPGEIWVSGPVLARGYRGRPDLTQERFVQDPNGSLWYRTGDFGRVLADSRIEYLGRRDGQVKIRGYRVELGEVEAHLKAQPGVADAVVVVRDDDRGKGLIGYCIASASAQLSPRDLRRGLSGALPDYMIPAAYAVVPEFPLTPSGKVDRKALAAVSPAQREDPNTSGPARDDVELQLCDLWCDVLDRHNVGVFENFFELGGDSFLGVRLIAGLRRLFGLDLTLADLFAAPTVATLAELVRCGRGDGNRSSVVRLQAGSGREPLYAFHPLPGTVIRYANLARALGSDQPVWGVQARGLHPGETPHTSIGAMVDDYLAALDGVHPGGPWHLIGYSMGGVLAVEAARRLAAAGEEVGLVGLLDTNSRIDIDEDTDYATRILIRFGLRLADVDVESLLALDPEARTRRLLALGVAAGTLPADYDVARLRCMLEMYRHNGTALASHEIRPYPGPVVLFRASDQSMDEGPVDPLLGWGELAAEVDVVQVPGDHFHMMEPGNVEVLAGAVRERLQGTP